MINLIKTIFGDGLCWILYMSALLVFAFVIGFLDHRCRKCVQCGECESECVQCGECEGE